MNFDPACTGRKRLGGEEEEELGDSTAKAPYLSQKKRVIVLED